MSRVARPRPPLHLRFPAGLLLAVLAALVLGACATPPPKSDVAAYRAYQEANDPLEPVNRVTSKFNKALEDVVLKPVAHVYNAALPRPARQGVTNFLRNLNTPVILANDLFQGEEDRAWDTFRRFFINSTVGVGGLIDVAKKVGIPYHGEDFGQTLAVHGVGEGPYIVLPVLGPSNPRDGIGLVVDFLMDPLFWVFRANDLDGLKWARRSVSAVDTYSRHVDAIEELERSSLDYYAALRSAYRQNRAEDIRNGRPRPLEEYQYDIFDELDEEEGAGGEEGEEPRAPGELTGAELRSLYSRYLDQ